MAEKKQLMRDFVQWGTENEKNRQEAIDAACRIITALNSAPAGKKLSEQDLDKLAGGGWCFGGTGGSKGSGIVCVN